MKENEKNTDIQVTKGEATLSLEKLLHREGDSIQSILDKISIGIVIINFSKKTVMFTNKHFDTITPPNKKEEVFFVFFGYLEKNSGSQKKLDIPQEMVIRAEGKELLINFTTYRVEKEVFVIFLNEVTSGIQYFLTKQENIYYSKLSDLIAEMVHEIGNPLSGIKTSLHILLHNISVWPLEKVTDYIERTINEINRLSEFLSRMREVSDENELNIKPTDLKEAVGWVLRHNEDLLIQKGIAIENQVGEGIIVLIDEGAFHQIMFNLINNSLHILPPGKKIKIYVEKIDEYYVRLIYRNNGEPIPEELMEKIFSPLYTTQAKRKGIGLAISLKLMTRMGGTLKVVPPEDGIGAKFVIYVPNSNKSKNKLEKK